MNNIENFEDFLGRVQGLLDDAKKQGHIIVRVEDLENAFPELKECVNKKPNGGIVSEDFNQGDGFYKVNLAYLSKEQVEEIESMVKRWNDELSESNDDRIKKEVLSLIEWSKSYAFSCITADEANEMAAWLENQANKDSQVTLPPFTFDDVLALQCAMETAKKIQEDDDLYEQLQSLHDRLHDAYWLEKEGECHISHDDEIMIKQLTEYFTTGHGLQNTNETVVEWLNDVKEKLEKEGKQKYVKWDKKDNGFVDLLLAIFANEHPNGLFTTGSIPVFKGEYVHSDRITNWLRSLKDKYALKPNPYTGTSFVYNSHTWGMCARDNGVDILYDSKLIKHVEDPQDKSSTETANEENATIAPKAEPKYHVGDWLASFDYEPIQIVGIRMDSYKLSNGDIDPIYMVDNNPNIRLWTIDDAKPGDIIYAESKYNSFDFIEIFAKIDNNNNFWGYCDVGSECDNYSDDLDRWEFDSDKGFVALDRYNFYPATKEQRNLLFSKMKEAGYVWDAVNKELTKTGPKFKDGDWIVYKDAVWKVGNIALESYYELLKTNNEVSTRMIEDVDENAHLWTIADAKDGDVLATDSWLYLFKYTNNKNIIQFHCNCPIDGNPTEWSFSFDDSYLDIYTDANIHPATKEQCDMLFQKMKDAGYEWDDTNKRLKLDMNGMTQTK